MATEQERNDTVRVLTVLRGVWDHALRMAESDGVPEPERAVIAGACLDAFLNATRGDMDTAGEIVGRAYLAAVRNYEQRVAR